ncbi:hypothetical protein AAH068_15965 [Bacteroides uniformis]|uniref:hypothetical protein n=1 Tax=Bacteroides uniformis TaxID=820 RepID=UPI0039B577D9
MKPELRYYPVTLFKTSAEVLAVSNTLNYKPDSEDSDYKCSRIFGFRAVYLEKSRFSGAIALIRCILRIGKRLYKK